MKIIIEQDLFLFFYLKNDYNIILFLFIIMFKIELIVISIIIIYLLFVLYSYYILTKHLQNKNKELKLLINRFKETYKKSLNPLINKN
jgi:Ca2+/Na+ antiporter